MKEIISNITKERNEKSFDLVFNKRFVSDIQEGENISYWGKKFNFLKGREYIKHYPENDLFSRLEKKSTAVVGNSGSVLNSKKGKEIDDHECIIRFNTAPLEGYGEYVGSDTDFRVSIGTLTYRTGAENILRTYRRKVQPKKDLSNEFFTEDFHFVLTHNFINWIQSFKEEDKRKRNVCSSGFVGVMFALLISEEVSIYGFNLPSESDDHDYHYHNGVQYSESSHNFQNEHEIYKQLEKNIDSFRWIKN